MTNNVRQREIKRLERKVELAKYNALRWLLHARDLTSQIIALTEDGYTREAIRLKMFHTSDKGPEGGLSD